MAPELGRELRPHILWDVLKEGAKLMLPFIAGLGIREWIHEYATALMWTTAFMVAVLVAFWDQFPIRKRTAKVSVKPEPVAIAEARQPANSSELTITRAIWGNDYNQIDVLSALKSKVRNALVFYVNHDAFPNCGTDPAPGFDRKYV